MGVQIALMFVPVIGWAIAGLLSVTQMIVGKHYQREMNKLIADTTANIKERAAAAESRVMEAAQAVYMQELPAGRALAMSSQPLGETIFERAYHAVVNLPKTVLRAAARLEDQTKIIIKDPKKQLKLLVDISPVGLARLAVNAATGAVLTGAKALESTGMVKEGKLSKPIAETRATVSDVTLSAARLASPFTAVQEGAGLTAKWYGEAAGAALDLVGKDGAAEEARRIGRGVHSGAQEMMTALTPTGSYNLLSGREGYVEAKAACEAMRTKAYASIDAMTRDGIAKVQSEEGRKSMRVSIAKRLREDPIFLQQMEEMRLLEEQEKAMLNKSEQGLTDIVGPPSEKPGVGTLVGIAAAAAAAFAFT